VAASKLVGIRRGNDCGGVRRRGSETAEANGPGYEGAAHADQGSILAHRNGFVVGEDRSKIAAARKPIRRKHGQFSSKYPGPSQTAMCHRYRRVRRTRSCTPLAPADDICHTRSQRSKKGRLRTHRQRPFLPISLSASTRRKLPFGRTAGVNF
jgi:hypothetical protein